MSRHCVKYQGCEDESGVVCDALKEAHEVLSHNNESRLESIQKMLGEKKEYLHCFFGNVYLLVNSVSFLCPEPFPCLCSSFSQLECYFFR